MHLKVREDGFLEVKMTCLDSQETEGEVEAMVAEQGSLYQGIWPLSVVLDTVMV